MFQKTALVSFYAQTAVHVGSGSEIGVVNLPIQREKHTTFPKMEASGIKGSLRGEVGEWKEEETFQGITYKKAKDLVFGAESDGTSDQAGAIAITDAKCLFFPVKSAKGVFAWVTCPFVLERFIRDLKLANSEGKFTEGLTKDKELPEAGTVSSESALYIENGQILLEENVYKVKKSDKVNKLIEFIKTLLPESEILNTMLSTNTAVLENDDFTHIVNLCTEVSTRIKIDNETGTVVKGSIFQEELLPAETILYSLFMTSKLFISEKRTETIESIEKNGGSEESFALDFLKDTLPSVIQVGGDTTLGKGLMAIKINHEGIKTREGDKK